MLNPIIRLLYEHSWLFGLVFVVTFTLLLDCILSCGLCIRRITASPRLEVTVATVGVQTEPIKVKDEHTDDPIPIEDIKPEEMAKE